VRLRLAALARETELDPAFHDHGLDVSINRRSGQ
jgi:hypothetical protein